jgi:hypothetical protein
VSDETEAAPEPRAMPEDTDADTYDAVQAEVDKHFEGSWERFLKAVENPAEILHFVLHNHCAVDAGKFIAWAKEKQLPPDWVPRFFSVLTPKGELKKTPEG